MNNISIVFTARNDNYGGDLLDRIKASVRVLIYLTNKYKSRIELVIVDYNPPQERISLRSELVIKDNKYLKVRFVTLPKTRHDMFKNSKKIKLFEYTAKNIGIRRASGDFIISTNQDIVFSEDFIKFILAAGLNKNAFYRTDRVDINLNPDLLGLPAGKLLERCKRDAYLRKTMNGDKFISYLNASALRAYVKNSIYVSYNFLYGLLNPQFKQRKLNSHPYHTFAAGDFLMMHKSAWNKVRGFDETKLGNDYLDGYILFVAGCLGLKQEIIAYDMYHIDHLRSKAGRPSVSYSQFVYDSNRMLKSTKPYKKNHRDWGHNKRQLKEVVIPFAR